MGNSANQNPDLIESQLQQELRSMFDVDTQEYLNNYLNLAGHLTASRWTADIQEMYRSIHTIKGGAVTVGADAILYVAIALEDILSNLRHLNPAPPLEDGKLGQILLEAGELLASAIPIEAMDEAAKKAVAPTLERLESLNEQVHREYLPNWSETTLLHQEFAEQGFDLVVLDLEIALEKETGKIISPETKAIAQGVLEQLKEIGKNLQLAKGWTELLTVGNELIENTSTTVWQEELPLCLAQLKICAKAGGKIIRQSLSAPALPKVTPVETILSIVPDSETLLDIEGISDDVVPTPSPTELSSLDLESLVPETSLEATELSSLDLESLVPETSLEATELSSLDLESLVPETILEATELSSLDLESLVPETSLEATELSSLDLESLVPETILEATELGFLDLESLVPETLSVETEEVPSFTWDVTDTTPTAATTSQITRETIISIPVPLTRLEQTTENLIEVLLAARASQGLYKNLQSQLVQLISLAKDSMNHITYLRQLQDDYALLNSLSRNIKEVYEGGVNLENYRQGYTSINRLLETSLRLSEIGEETARTAQKTAHNLENLDRNILKLQQTLEATRLVPFKNLAFRARAIIRDLITRYGKPATLIVQGEDIELDAGTATQLEPALLHLLRNSYDHGLEPEDERTSRGKPAKGTIKLSLQRQGNLYSLTIQDDGGGIDGQVISNLASAKGLPLTTTATPSELLAVLCQPGFSSQAEVSEVSGRGVGMDVVATQVKNLSGKLTLDTVLGVGTTFRIQIPVPRLLVSCLLLQVAERILAIPIEDIITTTIFSHLRATKTHLTHSFYSWQITNGTFTEPGLDLFDYWQSSLSLRNLQDTAVSIYIGSPEGKERAWLIADDLLGQTELLINPIPSPLEPPVGLIGLSLQFDGSLIPVLDAVSIAQWLGREQEIIKQSPVVTADKMASFFDQKEESHKVILVVDDAALMRRRIEASLTAYGYKIQTCVDGLDAWNWLQKNSSPILIITDIEMPNMDGFSLISHCRQNNMKVPILVVSSRLSQEWSTEAKRIGANDYLTKGFSTGELIDKVKTLIQ